MHFITFFEHLHVSQRPGPQVHVAIIAFMSKISISTCHFGRKLPSFESRIHPQLVGHGACTLALHSFQIQPACKQAHFVCCSKPFLDRMRLHGLNVVDLLN